MIVVVTGGTGLIGQALVKSLIQENYTVHILTRKPKDSKSEDSNSAHCKEFVWPENLDSPPMEAFPKKESYGVINLAGEPVSNWPWTKKKKEKIYSSRVNRTQQLVSALKGRTPQFFISASAVGIYGERENQIFTEESDIFRQNFFLQKVCLDWEESALRASSICRTVIFRLGIVLSYKGGFLYEKNKWMKKGFLPFIFNFKEFWLSWISITDLTSLILWAVQNESVAGVYNAVSPKPVELKQFYFALKNASEGLFFIRIFCPLFLLQKIGGEMFKNLLMNSKTAPAKSLSEGFIFKQKSLETALKQMQLNTN